MVGAEQFNKFFNRLLEDSFIFFTELLRVFNVAAYIRLLSMHELDEFFFKFRNVFNLNRHEIAFYG